VVDWDFCYKICKNFQKLQYSTPPVTSRMGNWNGYSRHKCSENWE